VLNRIDVQNNPVNYVDWLGLEAGEDEVGYGEDPSVGVGTGLENEYDQDDDGFYDDDPRDVDHGYGSYRNYRDAKYNIKAKRKERRIIGWLMDWFGGDGGPLEKDTEQNWELASEGFWDSLESCREEALLDYMDSRTDEERGAAADRLDECYSTE
jgi:hypothetical protein